MILHAGAVEKTLATAFSILITNGLEHAYFDHDSPPLLEIVFSLLVADGIVTYTFDTPPKPATSASTPAPEPVPRASRRSFIDVPIGNETDYTPLIEPDEPPPKSKLEA